MARRLFPDDIVSLRTDEPGLWQAVVERTHDDIETHHPFRETDVPEHIDHDPSISSAVFRRFMADGVPPKDTVLLQWQHTPSMRLVPVTKTELVDRPLELGDVVKRSATDAMSGTVVNRYTTCSLQPMYEITYRSSPPLKALLPGGQTASENGEFRLYRNGKPPPLVDIPTTELCQVESPTQDDLVIYKDWVGRVEDIDNRIQLRLSDGCVVEIHEDIGHHAAGDPGYSCIGDVLVAKKGDLRRGDWIFGRYNPNTLPAGTVVNVRTVTATIAWIHRRIGSADVDEPPSVLEAAELESSDFQLYDRTRRPVDRESVTRDISGTISDPEFDLKLNQRVRFRDLNAACQKLATASNPHPIPRNDRQDNLGYDLNVFDVISTRTEVVVQWQDLSMSVEKCTELIPDASIDDEHAAWPTEVVHTLALHPVAGLDNVRQPARVGIVQTVDALGRMAKIRWSKESFAHYSMDPDDMNVPGKIVDHKISPSSSSEEDISLYDIEAPGLLNLRRGDIVMLTSPRFNPVDESPSDVTWLGQLVDTALDGSLRIRLGAAKEVKDVIVSREECVVAFRTNDAMTPEEWEDQAMDGDDLFAGEDLEAYDGDYDLDWPTEYGDDDEAQELNVTYEDENGIPMNEEDVEDEEWESEEERDVEMVDAANDPTPPTSHSPTPSGRDGAKADGEEGRNTHTYGAGELEPPPVYLILDGDIPESHPFRNEPPTATPKHMKRTQKEHKILQNPSSLPEGVFVRTWESRLDLLRVLLVGPTDTPYENGPFMVDFYLSSAFPTEPPQAFFHSWPAVNDVGSLGRVNPNLYEDGKICLSLLGTWDGNRSEGWGAARSTLLQVIVSLLGLVLVPEPYYNEAGYENLVGAEASKLPSAIYSERVFLRVQGFIITALASLATVPERGLEGFEDVVRWLYLDQKGPKLLSVAIRKVEEVLDRSEKDEGANGLTVMSKGACIPLRRVLDRLRQLQAS